MVHKTPRTRVARFFLGLFVIAALASPASAQYFGRNKVRYHAFDFRVMSTEHFDIYFYPAEHDGVEIAARLAERWYSRLERLFGHALVDRQTLVLYASHADFEQTNIVTEEIAEGTGGLTEPQHRRIVLPLAGPIADTDHVIGTSWCTRFSSTSPHRPAARSVSRRSLACRFGSSKGWPSTCRSAASTPTRR